MADDRISGIRGLFQKVTQKGVRGCLAFLRPSNIIRIKTRLNEYTNLTLSNWINQRWDKQHGVDTWRAVGKAEFDTSDTSTQFAVYYVPTPASVLRFLIEANNLTYEQYQFVDFGSGKGKVLLIASEYSFKKVIGIEFDERLHNTAIKNLASFKGPSKQCDSIEAFHLDAQQYSAAPLPSFFFFYSPFHTELLLTVLENIHHNLAATPREAIICFLDDQVYNSQVPKVTRILSGWKGWEPITIPPIPKRWDMFHNVEVALFKYTG